MKLTHLLLVGGLAYLVMRNTSTASASSPISPPVQDATDPIATSDPIQQTTNSIQSAISSIIGATAGGAKWSQRTAPALFTVPSGFPHIRGSASNQFTGNTTGEYDLTFNSGVVRFLPYDPRETKTELNALIESARIAMVGNPTMYSEYRTLGNLSAAWSKAYAGVLS